MAKKTHIYIGGRRAGKAFAIKAAEEAARKAGQRPDDAPDPFAEVGNVVEVRRRAIASGSISAIIAAICGDNANALLAATPGGIEAQEAAGQALLVASFTSLPMEGMAKYRTALDGVGFKIGDPKDELFVSVTPPAGWTLRATEHSMWSEIVDDKGIVRGGVFYKAAFYDRRAHFNLHPRYHVHTEYGEDKVWYHVIDRATGNVLFDTVPVGSRDWTASDAAEKSCREWLDKTYPLWTSVEAYWGL
jgi:hypothetical protein